MCKSFSYNIFVRLYILSKKFEDFFMYRMVYSHQGLLLFTYTPLYFLFIKKRNWVGVFCIQQGTFMELKNFHNTNLYLTDIVLFRDVMAYDNQRQHQPNTKEPGPMDCRMAMAQKHMRTEVRKIVIEQLCFKANS